LFIGGYVCCKYKQEIKNFDILKKYFFLIKIF